jgi:non-reducing end alpha-L-arabinofuranosidase
MHLAPSVPRRARLAAACLLIVVSALTATTLHATTAAAATASLPCDIYATGGTPCVTAHSTTRALFASYNGPLYQIQRSSDSSFLNISVRAAGGVANAAPQVSFCAGTTCTITKIYDQTTNHNDLPISPGGTFAGPGPNGADVGANAMALPVTVGGQTVYGVLVTPGTGYRISAAKNVATGSQPEGIYMVTSSNAVNGVCCFDYGSGEADGNDDGNSTMNAIYWGQACWTGGCTGNGPWVAGDLENGMYLSAAGPNNPSFTGTHLPFVSAWEKNNGTTNFTLKVGDATTGGLTTTYSGALPNGYSPMKVQPSILLGTGGDNSDGDMGEFFEGAVTAGFPTDATENAVQASLTTAGYTGNSTLYATSESVISLRAHANGRYVDAANNGANPLIADSTAIGKNQTFDLFASPGGAISLRAHANGHIVTADNAGASPLIANRGSAGPWETFDLINNPDGSVSFRARANGKIVTAENAGGSALIANRTAVGPWEEFDLIRDTVPVSLRARANSRLVTAENAGSSPLIANRTAVGGWETFDLIGNNDGSVSFRAHANNQIVTADNAGGSPLIANRTAVGPWESFDLFVNADGTVSLRAHANSRVVTAPNGGASSLIASSTYVGQGEEFDLLFD